MDAAQKYLEKGGEREELGDHAGAREEYKNGLAHIRDNFAVPNKGLTEAQKKLADQLIERVRVLDNAATIRCPSYTTPADSMLNEYGIPKQFEHLKEHDTHLTMASRGVRWGNILKSVLEEGGFKQVVLNDGWGHFDSIRQLLELLIGKCETLTQFTLKSKKEWRRQPSYGPGSPQEKLERFEANLSRLAESCRLQVNDHRPRGVTFNWEVDENVHRRLMKFDDRWIFDLDHGLALWQAAPGDGPHFARIGHTDEGLRPTKAAHVMVWHKADRERDGSSESAVNGGQSTSQNDGPSRKRTCY